MQDLSISFKQAFLSEEKPLRKVCEIAFGKKALGSLFFCERKALGKEAFFAFEAFFAKRFSQAPSKAGLCGPRKPFGLFGFGKRLFSPAFC